MCEVRIEVTECSYPSRAGRVPAEPAASSPCHGSVRTHPHLQDQLLQAIPTRAQVLTEVLTSLFLVQAISSPSPSGGRLICGSATHSAPSWLHYRPTFAAREFLANSKAGKSSHLQPFSNSGRHKRPFPRVSNYIQVSGILDPGKRILFLPGGKVHVHGSKQTVKERNSDRSLDHQAGL